MWVLRAFSDDDDRLVHEIVLPSLHARDVTRIVGDGEPLVGVSHALEGDLVNRLLRSEGRSLAVEESVVWFLDFDAELPSQSTSPPSPGYVVDLGPGPSPSAPEGDMMGARAPAYYQHFVQFKRDIATGPGVPLIFVGSGLPAAARPYIAAVQSDPAWTVGPGIPPRTGPPAFPTWHELPSTLTDWLITKTDDELYPRIDDLSGRLDDYEWASRRFKYCLRDSRYSQLVRSRFEIPSLPFAALPPMYRALVSLPESVLVTTNYDNLIESAFEGAGRQLLVSSTYDDYKLQAGVQGVPHLLKLYGTLSRPETVILPGTQAAEARSAFQKVLADVLRTNRITALVFLGFEAGDPTLVAAREDVLLSLSRQTPESYGIYERPDRTSRLFYDTLGVRAIVLDSWDEAPTLLSSLSAT